jgi:hypothetical protein
LLEIGKFCYHIDDAYWKRRVLINKLFLAMIFIDIVVPVFIWLFLVILKKKSHVLNHEANVEDADFEEADAIDDESASESVIEEASDVETEDEEGN